MDLIPTSELSTDNSPVKGSNILQTPESTWPLMENFGILTFFLVTDTESGDIENGTFFDVSSTLFD